MIGVTEQTEEFEEKAFSLLKLLDGLRVNDATDILKFVMHKVQQNSIIKLTDEL